VGAVSSKVRAVTGSAPGFVKALRDARVAAGITQDEIAARLGWGRSRLHEYESAVRAIAPRQLERWAAELGLQIVAVPVAAREREGAL
jgi:transcriptional regulator with XRE-family HTH domain